MGRDRFHHWRIAYGSAKEVDCHLQLLMVTNAIDQRAARHALQLFDEVRAMTWRLLHPKP
ncbi:MAG: four helix bundle protein [Holophagae bacterium]